MAEKRKYIDAIHHFKGKWEMPSLCGIFIRRMDYGTLVILTEMYEENPGSSVTGMIEQVATEIVKQYGIDPATAVIIVHNPERSPKYEFFAESFYRAHMVWDEGRFHGLDWEKLDGFIETAETRRR